MDDAQGNTICSKCGNVMDTHKIVSDLQFTSGGSAVGYFLNPASGGQAAIFGGSKKISFDKFYLGRGF
jgi:hypothetical protein